MTKSSSKRNARAFEMLWKNTAERWFDDHAGEPGLIMPADRHASMLSVMDAYHSLNKYCSDQYMKTPEGPLNQRKIAACVTYAIVMVRPIGVDVRVDGYDRPCISGKKGSIPLLANERLALSVAASIILSFLEYAVRDDECQIRTREMRDRALAEINGGLDFMDRKDGGEWLLNMEKTLALRYEVWVDSRDNSLGFWDIPLLASMYAYIEAHVFSDPDTYVAVQRCFRASGGHERVF